MNLWIAFFLGVIFGWIIEWIIDFFYIRNKTRKLEAEIANLNNQLADLNIESVGDLEKEPAVIPSESLEVEWQPVVDEDTRVEDEVAVDDQSLGPVDVQSSEEVQVSEEEASEEQASRNLAEAALVAALVSDTDQEPVNDAISEAESTAPVWVLEEETEEIKIVDADDQVTEESLEPDDESLNSSTLKREIEYIEGVGPVYGEKLRQAGITNGLLLLKTGASPRGRAKLAQDTGIRNDLVLSWVNHVDLYRIKGIGSEFADLLERAGVDTVIELSRRNPQNLFDKIAAVNAEKKLVRQIPTLANVQDWVEQAKTLPRVVSY
jgi:predicted flap endonuclease-1-like 5' DNA nuclease